MLKILQTIVNFYKQDLFVRVTSSLMFLWYGVLRWFVLSIATHASTAWLHEPISAALFIYTIGFLMVIIFLPKQYRYQMFYESFVLSITNTFCLILMFGRYGKEPTFINYNFLILDFLILAYSVSMLYLCYRAKPSPQSVEQPKLPSILFSGLKYCFDSIKK